MKTSLATRLLIGLGAMLFAMTSRGAITTSPGPTGGGGNATNAINNVNGYGTNTTLAGTLTLVSTNGSTGMLIEISGLGPVIISNAVTGLKFIVDTNGFSYTAPMPWTGNNTNTAQAGVYAHTATNSMSITNINLAVGQSFTFCVTNSNPTATNFQCTAPGFKAFTVTTTNAPSGAAIVFYAKRFTAGLAGLWINVSQ